MGWHHDMYKEFVGSEGGFSGGIIAGSKDKICKTQFLIFLSFLAAALGECSGLLNNKSLFQNANIGCNILILFNKLIILRGIC